VSESSRRSWLVGNVALENVVHGLRLRRNVATRIAERLLESNLSSISSVMVLAVSTNERNLHQPILLWIQSGGLCVDNYVLSHDFILASLTDISLTTASRIAFCRV
jgi:hypothetical protein